MGFDAPGATRLYLFTDDQDFVVAEDRDDVRAVLCEEFPCFEDGDGDTPEALARFRLVPDEEPITVRAEDTPGGEETRTAVAWVAHLGRGLLYSRAWDLADEDDEEAMRHPCEECGAKAGEPCETFCQSVPGEG